MGRPGETRLVLDVMVGGLTSILRMVGYDTVYALDQGVESDDQIIALAERDDRLLVTRDTDIARRHEDTVLLESTDTDEQLRELAAAGLELELTEPERCSRCNGRLEPVIEGSGPADGPDPNETSVWRCIECDQYFWRGSHWADVRRRLASI